MLIAIEQTLQVLQAVVGLPVSRDVVGECDKRAGNPNKTGLGSAAVTFAAPSSLSDGIISVSNSGWHTRRDRARRDHADCNELDGTVHR